MTRTLQSLWFPVTFALIIGLWAYTRFWNESPLDPAAVMPASVSGEEELLLYLIPGRRYTAADIEVQAREILRIQKRMEEIYAFHTGRTIELIRQDLSRDFWLGAQETVEYGLADQVVGRPAEGEGLQDTPPSTNGTNATNGTSS